MSIVRVRRRPRRFKPELPSDERLLESPPELPEFTGAVTRSLLGYVAVACSLSALALLVLAGSEAAGRWRAPAVGLVAGSLIATLVSQMRRTAQEREERLGSRRRSYLRYLRHMDRQLHEESALQRRYQLWIHPASNTLWALAMTGRLWERRPTDADFGQVRVGVGPQQRIRPLVPPQTRPLDELDPVSAHGLRRLIQTHGSVPDLPIAVSLPSFARIVIDGDPDSVRGMARAMIAQLATLHAPHDLRISVCTSSVMAPHWDWVKWLPHAQHPTEEDALGPLRLVRRSLAELEDLLSDDLPYRPRFTRSRGGYDAAHHVIVLDGGLVSPDSVVVNEALHGVTIIDLGGAPLAPVSDEYTVRAQVTPNDLRIESAGAVYDGNLPDSLTIRQSDALARQLAPLRIDLAASSADHLTNGTPPATLFGLDDPRHIDLAEVWRDPGPRGRLKVPLGLGIDGLPVELDFKEASQGGDGPHGICVGATGSGKSELLRTLILGLALAHPPEEVNFVLVDFKGGATYFGPDPLPHVAHVVTNLAGDAALAKRTLEYLQGELNRRQELLRAAGNYSGRRDYERARTAGAPLDPLPALFLVIDEFSELLVAHPDAIDVLVGIGRVGRSLGVHMLLASQRLEEGRLRGLDTYLSYRIGLRTFSAQESRIVLGVPDAYELPAGPGHGYLKTGTDALVRFKATYVSGPVDAGPSVPGDELVRSVAPFVSEFVRPEVVEQPLVVPDAVESVDSFMDVVVRQLAGHGHPAHPVLLPPLEHPRTLDTLLPPLERSADVGLSVAAETELRGRLCAVLGVDDRPYQQSQGPYWLDLSGSAGHVALVGAPDTGVTNLLHALILSLSLLHTPRQVQFHCIDTEGSLLDALTELPHLGTLAALHEADLIYRMVNEMTALLERREREYADTLIDSAATFRRLRDRRQPEDHDGRHADVFLAVHGWRDLQKSSPDLVEDIVRLASRGLAFGVHVVITGRSWSEISTGLRDLLGSRIELRLRDPDDSVIDRRQAARLPRDAPGHGLTGEGLHFLAALPRIDGDSDVTTLREGVARLVSSVAEAWQGPVAAPVRALSVTVTTRDLPTVAQTGARVSIGLDRDTLAPVLLDFTTEPHFLILGDPGCGKSNLLRLIATGIAERHTAEQATIFCIDYRRSLADLALTGPEFRHAATSVAAARLVHDLIDGLGVPGRETYLILDDYDLFLASPQVLEPLAELLSAARGTELHVIIAQRYTGTEPGQDPVLLASREAGSPALLMSGSTPHRDPLLGNVRPQTLPVGRGLFVDRGAGTRLVQTALATRDPAAASQQASRSWDRTS
ncbi:type VII secretion protein EccCa [Streptomyces sp. NPDC005355]|uniref:type VII secretion protein EccCa n=1 Tax=Streptomyces sp. NPDC005355 TaxID=3157038 RepID=UPI0033BD8D37